MAYYRRRKRPLKAKYVLRRLFLAALLLTLAGGGAWFAYTKLPFKLAFVPSGSGSSGEPRGKSSGPEPDSSSGPESEPGPDSSSEPEPEPEPRETMASPDSWELILANGDNPLPQGYAPPELETIVEPYSVDSRIIEPALRMLAKAREDGVSLLVVSAYRSEDRQRQLFDSKIQEHIAAGKSEEDAVAAAALYVARPGSSEHQTGLAIDIVTDAYTALDDGYAGTHAARWLVGNAFEYGFTLRYPEGKTDITGIAFEPWHYRYVGEDNARAMKELDLCLEEYLDMLNGVTRQEEPDEFATPATPAISND